AQGPAGPSIFSNALAILLIVLMIVLLIIIGLLSHVLMGAADIKLRKTMAGKTVTKSIVLLLAFLPAAGNVFAQDPATTAQATTVAAAVVGGLPSTVFYVMVSVIFLELLVIFFLLINIKFLIKKTEVQLDIPDTEIVKEKRLSWWDRINKLRP